MRARTLLRISPGVWLAPALVALCVYYVNSYVARGFHEPYAVALTSRAITTLGFVAPICAALGAWEGGRLRRAGSWSLPWVRSRAKVAGILLLPIVVAGSLAVTAGILRSVSAAGLLMPDLRPLWVVLAVVVAHTAVGFAAGLWLPLPVAVPGVLLGSLVWMVVLRALHPPWLMMLNGETIELCCGSDTDLASAAALGPVVVAVAVTMAASVLVAGSHLSRIRCTAGAALLGVGIVVGAVIVTPIGGDPSVARDPQALVCNVTSTGVRICVWPEHEPRLDAVAAIAQDALARWHDAGIEVPTVVTEGERGTAGTATIGLVLTSTPPDILDSLAQSMVPVWPACDATEYFPGGFAAPYLEAWFAETAGMSSSELRSRWGDDPGVPGAPGGPVGPKSVPPVLTLVAQVRAAPAAVQRDWVLRNQAAMADCHTEPRLLLSE